MTKTLIISIDAMGGDNAPDIVVQGVDYYLKHGDGTDDVQFLLHGDQAVLVPLITKQNRLKDNVVIKHTPDAITMDTKPSHALRRGQNTSMWNAIKSVKDGEADSAISAGNTGALMAMSRMLLRMKGGMQRPALAAVWPNRNGMSVILDAGANVSCNAAQLTEFAVLGESYYRSLYQTDKPRIGILNNGTEELKGSDIVQAAHQRLSESHLGLNYVGFVEGNGISSGLVDVVVTDGFTGNIAIKTAEGTARHIGDLFKETLQSTLWSKLTAVLNYVGFKKLKDNLDPRKLNGGVFLGLNGIVIKSHGGTDAIGFSNALSIAVRLARSSLLEDMETTLTALHDEDDDIGFLA